jgi:lysozyme
MRTFNEREKYIINSLDEYAKGESLYLETFLENYYFKESLNRGLIIQNQRQYAVLFIKLEKFQDTTLKSDEINHFLECMSLLKWLIQEGIIRVFREKTENFYFIQDDFKEAKIIKNGTIILNSKGYFSSAPDTICDAQKNDIYKGIQFSGEQFQLIINHCVGNLIISESINNLLVENNLIRQSENNNKNEVQKSNEIQNKITSKNTELNSEKTTTAATKSDISPSPLVNEKGNQKVIQKQSDTEKSSRKKSNFLPLLYFISAMSFIILFLIYIYYNHKKLSSFSNDLKIITTKANIIIDSVSSINVQLENLKKNNQILSDTSGQSLGIFYGIDISKWNGNEISEIPTKDSLTFIICKATEGISYIDNDFYRNWDFMQAHQYIKGTYHFYHVNQDPLIQANHFLSVLATKEVPDIAPIVDIEQASVPINNIKTNTQIQTDLLTFLKQIELKTKRTPIIYTDLAFADEYLLNPSLSNYPIWLAEYTNQTTPKIPITWAARGFMIWQKRDNYFVDSHATDFDVFYGIKENLLR